MIQTTNRRELLKRGGAFAASFVLPGDWNALTRLSNALDESAPTLLPLEVIALNRMAFGARPGDLDAFRALPGATEVDQFRAYVEQQLNPAQIDDRACAARLAAAKFTTLGKSLAQLWADHVVNNPYVDKNADKEEEWRMLPATETRAATLLRAVYSRRQLVEVLADFWHNHFNVYAFDDNPAPVFVHYDRDVIRAHLLGNFRQMLEAVATSPAMLFYLDNATNANAGPNENYARELFELHTLGAANYLGVRDPATAPGFAQHDSAGYVDNDVQQAARAFTGWRVDDDSGDDDVENTGAFLYYPAWHDRSSKLILGRSLPPDQTDLKDGRDVLNLVAFHPGTARHIARKLCVRLIGDNPSDRVVNAAADVFLANKDAPDQLKQVTRAILLSEEFRATWGAKIKRPFEAAVGMLRALNVEFTAPPDAFFDAYGAMGQPLFEHTAPNGYPDRKEAWANTMSLLYRWKLGNALIEGDLDLTVDLAGQMPTTVRTSNGIADYWINRLLGRAMPAASRNEIVQFIANGVGANDVLSDDQIAERLPGAVELILNSPDFQWR